MISRANWLNITSVDSDSAVTAVNRVLPPLISLALVILIAWQLARMVWMLVPGTSAGVAVPLPDLLPASAGSTNISTDVSQIADAHIFGVADAAPEGLVAIVSEEGLSMDQILDNVYTRVYTYVRRLYYANCKSFSKR